MKIKLTIAAFVAVTLAVSTASSFGQVKKPNILIIWGDDIGYWNVSAYNQGMMGYKTPNIDRIAKEGGLFTDWTSPARSSCHPRHASIHSIRTARSGLSIRCTQR